MKVAIIGAGNVGTFLTAAILSNATDSTLAIIDRNPERLRQLQKFGAHYQAGAEQVSAPCDKCVFATSMAEAKFSPDIVFIATKSYDLTSEFFLKEVQPFLQKDAKIILVQNGCPNSEVVRAIGDNVAVMVVNAGFSLDFEGRVSITNKPEIDLPYGFLTGGDAHELQSKISSLLVSGKGGLKVRHEPEINRDIWSKAQYACIGAYCAIEAFKHHHPRDKKFTFADLAATGSEENIAQIAKEVGAVFGSDLLSREDLDSRRALNAKLENSLVTDARGGNQMERAIVDNILAIAAAKKIATPALLALSNALKIIEKDKWELKAENVAQVQEFFPPQACKPSVEVDSKLTQQLALVSREKY